MNRTQKVAWVILFGVLLDAVAFVYVGLIIALRRLPPKPLGWAVTVALALAGLTLFVGLAFALARRQSRAEPESDERDKAIMKNAALVGLITGWLVLALAVLILGATLGQTGTVPLYMLTLLLFGVFFFVTVPIYAVGTLAQYRSGGRP